jgi:hypothetical protein
MWPRRTSSSPPPATAGRRNRGLGFASPRPAGLSDISLSLNRSLRKAPAEGGRAPRRRPRHLSFRYPGAAGSRGRYGTVAIDHVSASPRPTLRGGRSDRDPGRPPEPSRTAARVRRHGPASVRWFVCVATAIRRINGTKVVTSPHPDVFRRSVYRLPLGTGCRVPGPGSWRKVGVPTLKGGGTQSTTTDRESLPPGSGLRPFIERPSRPGRSSRRVGRDSCSSRPARVVNPDMFQGRARPVPETWRRRIDSFELQVISVE